MNKRETRRDNPESRGIAGYLWTMLLSAAAGAALMWLGMSQRSSPTEKPSPFVTPNKAQTSTAPAAPDLSGLPAADAAVVRGNLAYDHQRWAQAIREYQSAITNGRDNADVRTDLGNAFRFSGQPEKALEQYT